MGLYAMLLGPITRYTMKTERHSEITANNNEKALAASHECVDPAFVNEEPPNEASKGTQSQLME